MMDFIFEVGHAHIPYHIYSVIRLDLCLSFCLSLSNETHLVAKLHKTGLDMYGYFGGTRHEQSDLYPHCFLKHVYPSEIQGMHQVYLFPRLHG